MSWEKTKVGEVKPVSKGTRPDTTTIWSSLLLLRWEPPRSLLATNGETNCMTGCVVAICTRGKKSTTWPGEVDIAYLGRIHSLVNSVDSTQYLINWILLDAGHHFSAVQYYKHRKKGPEGNSEFWTAIHPSSPRLTITNKSLINFEALNLNWTWIAKRLSYLTPEKWKQWQSL